MPGGLIALVGSGLGALGVGETTAGILAPILSGAGFGAATSAATGGDPLKGAITGGFTGGFGELAAPFAAATGIGTTAADAITQAAGGAVGQAVTGGDPLKGAEMGGVSGLVSGLTAKPAVGATGAGGTSAVSTAAPTAALNTGVAPDLTSGGGFFDNIGRSLGLSGGPSAPSPVTITPAAPGSGVASPGATPGAVFGQSPGAPSGAGTDLLSRLGIKSDQILPMVGTALSAFRGPPGDLKRLEGMATQLGNQGAALSSAVQTGVLPPGLEAALHQATRASKANIKGTYANLGLSGSTMEAQALNAADESASAQAFSYARDLLSTGIQESGLSAQLFASIMAANESADTNLTNAIAGFAGASQGGVLPAGFRVT